MNDWLPALACSTVMAAAAATATLLLAPAWKLALDKYLNGRNVRFRGLGLDEERLNQALTVWAGLLVAAALVTGLLWEMLPIAGLLVVAGCCLPRWCVDWLILRRERLFRDQVAPACRCLANGAKAGLSLSAALATAARETPAPLAEELTQIVQDYERGRPLQQAIQAADLGLGLEPFSRFAAAVCIALERGGRLDAALERIAKSIQESVRLEKRLAAHTAAGLRAVKLLALFPFGFMGFFWLLDPHSMDLVLHTLPGQLVICGVAVLTYIALRWAWSIVDVLN